ncbi:MAG: HAMP domain-containing protein, partial [Burkholderiales bacterium]|nr:HAMP domain-containing protein [Phycisphaerae bacterium]
MSNRSYLLRLIIPFAVMMVVVVALSGWLIYQAGVAGARAQQIIELKNDAALLATVVGRAASMDDAQVMQRLREEGKFREVRYTLIASDGRVTFDSEVPLEQLDNHNDRSEVLDARGRGTGQSVRRSSSQGIMNIYAANTVAAHPGFVVRVSRPERAPLWVNARTIALLAGAAALSIGIVSWLAITLHRRWVAPVRRLADAAEQMAAGQWQTRIAPDGTAELREFTTRLNLLAQQAQKQLEDLQQQRSDLTLLVDSLPDPILLTDAQHRVVLLNAPAARFLQVTLAQAINARFFSVLGEPSLLDLYELASRDTKPRTPHMREIRVVRAGQRYTYQAVAVRMPAGGIVLVLRDVTRLAAAVLMKTDFVANASHELRTPIAAIKLAFETLSEVYTEDAQQTARCITIIEGHLKRLEDLLQDLLDLSRVENSEIKPEIMQLRLGDVIGVIRNTMTPLARNKNIELIIEADETITFHSDRRLLDLVLKNLVENAVKYTPSGGRVTVRVERDAGVGASQIMMQVADTGIGIPPQHLERVFERFYQVDAARSGSSGRGTGLGLAIVKHALMALGGTVKLDSVVGRGTTVTCL